MSINNILLTADNPPLYKYAKTVKSKLSGRRLDPLNGKETIFLLESSGDGIFQYENDVLELYSEKEHKYFLQTNKYFIKEGLLKQYTGQAEEVSLENVLSDEDVEVIATIRTIPALAKRLQAITSVVALNRVKLMAQEIGRPQSVVNCVDNRIKELENQ